MSETYTLYKLIVLYMLDKVDFPLTTSQISEFILEKEYTTYFKLQETLAEMENPLYPACTIRSVYTVYKFQT